MTSRDPESQTRDPNTLRATYFGNSWRCYSATRKPSCRWQTRTTRCNVIVAPSGKTPSNINEIYTSMKSKFSGLQFRRW